MRIHRPARTSGHVAVVSIVLALLAVTLVAARPAKGGADHSPKKVKESAAAEQPLDAVRLSLQVGTSSDWTVVRVQPGEVLAATVKSSSNARVERYGAAWSVRPIDPSRQAWATVEAVVHETGTKDVQLSIDKGWSGRTRAALKDVQRGEALLTATNDRQSVLDPNNRRTWTLEREDVYAEPLELPRATQDKKVLAFYYPWFADYDDPAMTDRPRDPRSTYAAADVRDMTHQAAKHGVDGFVVSWAGEQADGWGFDRAVKAAEAEGQEVAGYLEVPRAPELNKGATVYGWLQQLLSRADSPAYVRHDGTPVVFVYAMEELPPWMWATMQNKLAQDGQKVKFVGDTGRPEYADVTWGEHRYSALGDPEERAAKGRRQALALRAATAVEGADPMAWVATVAPGYDDHLVRDGNPVVERDGGKRYAAMWDAAEYSNPDWVVITSWNEWYEGTSIEPSEAFGDRALRQTKDRASRWTGTRR